MGDPLILARSREEDSRAVLKALRCPRTKWSGRPGDHHWDGWTGAIGLDLRFFQVRSRHLRCLEGILDERVRSSRFQYAE